jgi:hypothetical protein
MTFWEANCDKSRIRGDNLNGGIATKVMQSTRDSKISELILLVDGELIMETEMGIGWGVIERTIKVTLRLEELKRSKGAGIRTNKGVGMNLIRGMESQ